MKIQMTTNKCLFFLVDTLDWIRLILHSTSCVTASGGASTILQLAIGPGLLKHANQMPATLPNFLRSWTNPGHGAYLSGGQLGCSWDCYIFNLVGDHLWRKRIVRTQYRRHGHIGCYIRTSYRCGLSLRLSLDGQTRLRLYRISKGCLK